MADTKELLVDENTEAEEAAGVVDAVSYTHLTLPTILRV